MEESSIPEFRSWFKAYVNRFRSEDQSIQRNITLKEEHTFRVCENIISIARSVGLDDRDARLAETIALFHDLGRFEQLRRYGTFSDMASENHALLSLKALDQSRVLSCLKDSEKKSIFRAIELHNQRHLPSDEPADSLLLSKLIRDADKLDILGITVGYLKEREKDPNPAIELNMPDTPGCSQKMIEDILSCNQADIQSVKNYNDMKLFYLTWIFDINFDFTLKSIVQRGYVEEMAKSLPDTEDVSRAHSHINCYIAKRAGIQ